MSLAAPSAALTRPKYWRRRDLARAVRERLGRPFLWPSYLGALLDDIDIDRIITDRGELDDIRTGRGALAREQRRRQLLRR
ncbi:MAG: hypothetical protein U0165_15760 [Polyangiaceae bacterium]